MGVERNSARMKTIVLLTVIFTSALAFDVNLNPESESSRSFCCLFYNANTECANWCAGRDCTEQCNINCGIFNSLCGSMTCSSVTSNCVTNTTTTSTSPTTCTPVNTSCSADAPCCTGNCMPDPDFISWGLTCQETNPTASTSTLPTTFCYPANTPCSADAPCCSGTCMPTASGVS